MALQSRRSFMFRLLTGILGIGCVVGTLFGLLNGDYLLALSQVFFAAAMTLIFFDAEGKGTFFVHLAWACLGIGISATAVAALA